MELPPRARRIRWSERQKGNHHGTTSACAENTGWWGAHQHIDGNYLRVRGEYCVLGVNVMANRTTSACAENTKLGSWRTHRTGNYLRVRGEYNATLIAFDVALELPPRARRIPKQFLHPANISGTTSACAENTPHRLEPHRIFGELPPRARRIRLFPQCGGDHHGTTSACAENTRGRRQRPA